MLLTKILVSLQLLHYYNISAHPLLCSQTLAKRSESTHIAEVPHPTRVNREESTMKLDGMFIFISNESLGMTDYPFG
jgi:hypothetical protein